MNVLSEYDLQTLQFQLDNCLEQEPYIVRVADVTVSMQARRASWRAELTMSGGFTDGCARYAWSDAHDRIGAILREQCERRLRLARAVAAAAAAAEARRERAPLHKRPDEEPVEPPVLPRRGWSMMLTKGSAAEQAERLVMRSLRGTGRVHTISPISPINAVGEAALAAPGDEGRAGIDHASGDRHSAEPLPPATTRIGGPGASPPGARSLRHAGSRSPGDRSPDRRPA